ncbi:MAG: amidohydrolase [Lachnospiraceae bacterium]|nr:amidohydrolase [Lachnospiraceae bacterium]
MNYKIRNGKVLKSGAEKLSVVPEDLYVIEGKVYEHVPEGAEGAIEEVDAGGHLIMPGLINLHTHAYMTLLRNYADDVDFDEWLFRRVMPVEDSLPQEGAYWTTLLACMEMIRTGTTCFNDMHMFKGQSAKAAAQAGMRAFIGRGLVGEDLYGDGLSRFRDALEEQEEWGGNGLLEFVLAPHAVYSCSPKLYGQVAEEAAKRHMLKHTHVSESDNEVRNCLGQYGKTPVELLRDAGFLDDRTILAHCVKMQGDDIQIIADAACSVVTNPASNAKLGNGFAPLSSLSASGVRLTLGTDGTSSNNTLNLFREMNLVSLIHKGIAGDSTALPSDSVIRMVTENPAAAVGMQGRLGVISDGANADLVFIDLNEPSLFPNNNIVSSLCYSANGSEVDSVMIDGKFVMRRRQFLTIDAERVRYEVRSLADRYLSL